MNQTGALSKAQKRYLAEIRAEPGRISDGRASRSLHALEVAGLIRTDYDLIPRTHGNGLRYAEEITAWPI